MKVTIEIDMTAEEARKAMGLPDVSRMHEKVVAEMQKRILAGLEGSDPQILLKAWGGQGLEQFQKFLWDSARSVSGAGKDRPKSAR